jgi:hypothetical protein
MYEVTKEEFYKRMGPLNVHPQIVGQYPYTSIFRDQRTMQEVGRIEEDARYLLMSPVASSEAA